MKIALILAAVIGCSLAANTKRQAGIPGGNSNPSNDHHVHLSDSDREIKHIPEVAHHEVPVIPAVVHERHGLVEEPVPVYPEFGVKVQKSRSLVRPRGRAVYGGNEHNFNYVQVPHPYAPTVVAPKTLVPPYQQKPLREFASQQNYQPNYNKFFTQKPQRTDDVAQPISGPVPAADGNAPPPKPIAILNMNQDVNYDGTFVYDFEAENGIKSAVSGSTKRLEGVENPVSVMAGTYSYTSPEGLPVETKWYADETGFHAEGDHLPVAPPMPEAIRRAVEYLKTLPPQQEVAAQPVPEYFERPQKFDKPIPQNYYDGYPSYQEKPVYDKYPVYQQQKFDKPFYPQQNFDRPAYSQQNFDRPVNPQQNFDKPTYPQQQHNYESYPSKHF